MYRIYKEILPLGDSQNSSTVKSIESSFSALDKAEECIQNIYKKYCNGISSVTGTNMDFRIEEWRKEFHNGKDYYPNCLVHYWLEETHFVNNGEQIIDISGLDYDTIGDFYFERSIVSKDGKYGIIDLSFRLILGLYYDGISRFVLEKNVLHEPICRVCYMETEFGFVDQNGRFIVVIGEPTTDTDRLSSIGRIPSENVLWAYKSQYKWVRVELKTPSLPFDNVYSFFNVESNSFAPFLGQEDGDCIIAASDFTNGMARIKKTKTKEYGSMNLKGEVSVPIIYDELSLFSENGLAVFCKGSKEVVEHHSPAHFLDIKYKKGGKWGAINSNGEIQIPAMYDNAYSFSDGLSAVNKGGDYYVYLWERPSFYQDSFIPLDLRESAFTRFFAGGKWGFIDMNGNECIPFQYDKVSSFKNGIAIVNIGGRWTGGSLRYAYDIPTYEQRRPYFVGGLYGIINKKGELIVPMIYSSLHWEEDYSSLRGTIGGTLIIDEGEYHLEDPEKEVTFSPDGTVIEEDNLEGVCGMRWPV